MPAGDAEIAADRLRIAGAWAIEERGDDPVELRTVISSDDDEVVRRLGDLPGTWQLEFHDAIEVDSSAWREHARPVVVSPRLTLRPAWLPVPRTGGGPGRGLDIAIEPGAAFGLGDHPTTRLCAAAVDRLVRPGDRVLDVGCGTGVLSIVAACLGAGAVEAIDISPAAVEQTVDNAVRNGVTATVSASTTPLHDVAGRYDLVVANVPAPELVAMAVDLRGTVAPHGRLIVSGVLAAHHAHVLVALRPMTVVATSTSGEWAAVELRHP